MYLRCFHSYSRFGILAYFNQKSKFKSKINMFLTIMQSHFWTENIETFFDIKYVFHKRSWHKKQSNFSKLKLLNYGITKCQMAFFVYFSKVEVLQNCSAFFERQFPLEDKKLREWENFFIRESRSLSKLKKVYCLNCKSFLKIWLFNQPLGYLCFLKFPQSICTWFLPFSSLEYRVCF